MAESNPTQVILTDDGLKIINAQKTADNAASGVLNLNDPYYMSVIEKQNNIGQFAGLTSQYNVLIQNAKDDGIDTIAVTTAYNNLNRFMADILADPNHASYVDRVRYKKYQDAYNEELAKLQNALQNNTNNKFTSAANATSQAASTASQAFIQAQSAVDYANSETAVQSVAIDKAQSAASDAVSKAESTASEFGRVDQKAGSALASALNAQGAASDAVSQASSAAADSKDAKQIAGAVRQSYKTLTDGSTMTIAELESGLAVKLTKSDLDGYATETWAQNQIKTTADGINGTLSSVKTTVDGHDTRINELKADSSSFKTQFTTVNDTISKHTTDIETLQASSKSLSASFDSLSSDNQTSQHNISQLQASAKTFNSTLTTVQTQVQNSAVGTNLLTGTSNAQDYTVSGSGWVSGSQSSNSTNKSIPCTPGASYTYSAIVKTATFNCYPEIEFYDSGKKWIANSGPVIGKDTGMRKTTAVAPGNAAFVAAHMVLNNPADSQTMVFNSEKLEKGSVATDWSLNPEDQATQSQITQLSNDINLRVTKDGLISQINLQAHNTLISSGGQLTLSGKNILLDSDDPVIMKSANIDRILVDKQLKAADIEANTFSTNNGTFIVKQDGSVTAKNMTLIGGTLTSPTINTSTINGSTINGTTFNAGARLNSYGNTSHPLTINPDGSLTSTSFKSIATENAALRTFIKDGTVKTSLRGMTPFSPGMYSAADVSLGAGQLALLEGYSNSQDPNFTASNLKTTGYAILDASTGLSLHGTTQSINFSGTDKDQSTGITMNSYGNIYAQPNSSWWRIGDVNGNQIINFGIDKAGSNNIEFKRDIEIGNIGINRAHSIITQDGRGLYINSGRGGRADLNVASLNYTRSVSKSLLSEKRDVKKVNTAYWAQLVNSIDLATYQYKDDDNTSNLRLSGIVDDVNENKQWNLPDIFVARDEDGKLSGIENIVLQNAMLATIQEQQKEIDQLNGHNMELEAKLNSRNTELEARLNKLEAKLNG